MARQSSFGDTLRQARERKGLDLATAARKLRIRPDILRAIEDGDFAHMPPRGYTSNMVGAYARLVGLNPTEIMRAYRDEAYQFETGRRPVGARSERGHGDGRSVIAGEGRRAAGRTSQRETYAGAVGRNPQSGRSGERRRRNAAPPQPGYTNLVQGRQAPGIAANFGSMLPLVGVGVVVLILLIVVLFFAFGNGKGAPADDAPSIPISGMPNPAGTDTGATGSSGQDAAAPAVQPVAPTVAKFTYKVADGKEVYIEVKVDGKTKQADNVTGPKEMSYDVADELKFTLSGDPADVTLTVDGNTVELTEAKSGVYVYKMTFAEFLEDWKRENGVAGTSSSADAGQSDGGAASDGSQAPSSSDDESSSDGGSSASSDN